MMLEVFTHHKLNKSALVYDRKRLYHKQKRIVQCVDAVNVVKFWAKTI